MTKTNENDRVEVLDEAIGHLRTALTECAPGETPLIAYAISDLLDRRDGRGAFFANPASADAQVGEES